VLADQLPTIVEKAVASEQHSEGETTSLQCMCRIPAVLPARHNSVHRRKSACRRTDARRRAAAFARAFGAHVTRLQSEPQAYGELGLADLLEMREEALREFGFLDVYRCPAVHAAHMRRQPALRMLLFCSGFYSCSLARLRTEIRRRCRASQCHLIPRVIHLTAEAVSG
jgi:hypothetical protein